MSKSQYQARQLINLLEKLEKQQSSGSLHLNAEINSQQRKKSRVLVWNNGRIVYAGLNVPNKQEFAKMLGQKLKRESIDTAINVAMQRATTQTSIREFLEFFVRMRLFTWEQIEALVHTQVVLTLEQVLPHAGQFEFDSTTELNICRDLELSNLMQDITRRQEQWSTLAPLIPSPEAVPQLPANALAKITDPAVRQHIQQSVDGQRSLVDIAQGLDKDPLQVAQSYLHWVQAGWVMFEGSKPVQKSNLPTILAVDDSPVMQATFKRALADYYQVLVASNAVDALSLLNQNKVALLLLDVSMPDIDGLELCRTLRSMPQFSDLPIIMVTAKDGFVDKLKGQIAGSTQYLTKPFDAENLRQVVGKYLNVGTASKQ